MPCYLFTYHAYRSWMPDRRQGYVRRHEGILPRDLKMAAQYEENAKFAEIRFTSAVERSIIETLCEASSHIACRLHYVATDISHVHVLVSWIGEREREQLRNSLKKAATISLKHKYGDRPWFSEGASRIRVRTSAHFEYLVSTYLPKHDGWQWCEGRG